MFLPLCASLFLFSCGGAVLRLRLVSAAELFLCPTYGGYFVAPKGAVFFFPPLFLPPAAAFSFFFFSPFRFFSIFLFSLAAKPQKSPPLFSFFYCRFAASFPPFFFAAAPLFLFRCRRRCRQRAGRLFADVRAGDNPTARGQFRRTGGGDHSTERARLRGNGGNDFLTAGIFSSGGLGDNSADRRADFCSEAILTVGRAVEFFGRLWGGFRRGQIRQVGGGDCSTERGRHRDNHENEILTATIFGSGGQGDNAAGGGAGFCS